MNGYSFFTLFLLNICFVLSLNVCLAFETTLTSQPTNNSTSVVESTVTETPSTTVVNNITCDHHDNDCIACVAYSQCYYCETDHKCRFKFTKILTEDYCRLKDIHYLTCRVNFQYLLIGIGVLLIIAFLIITIFCCICCCRRKGIRISKDDLKWVRQREERKQIQLERRQERAERTEEIRKKYGLVKSSNPYQRFDDK